MSCSNSFPTDVDETKQSERLPFRKQYILVSKLGDGAWGKVYKCKRISDNKEFAVKIIPSSNTIQMENEILFLKKLRKMDDKEKSYFVQLVEHFVEPERDFIVMELCNKDDLFGYIADIGFKDEEECKIIFMEIIKGVKELHDLGIVHRDLKPENILLKGNNQIKICDFGLSYFSNIKMNENTGTPIYKAPEVIKEKYYNYKIDWWACGLILYTMVTKRLPFPVVRENYRNARKMKKEQENRIMKGKYFTNGPHKNISDDAKDLIKNLLTVNPKKRFEYDDIINHPWMKSKEI